MHVHIATVPYDSGHAGVRMGRGPEAFLGGGLLETLRAAGHTSDTSFIEVEGGFRTEATSAFELGRALARDLGGAAANGALPLVLTGNCISAVGTVAGIGSAELGILWFDAHGDFHTPETTSSGFLDGMALAITTGQCWRTLAGTVPGFVPVPAKHVILAGARDFDRDERERFEAAGGSVLDDAAVRSGGATSALANLRRRVERLYVHVDLDVLDVSEGRANAYAAAGGLKRKELLEILRLAREEFSIVGMALSAYDPAEDGDGRILDIGLEAVAELVAESNSRGD